MGKCEICDREQEKLHSLKDLRLCNKHYSQYQQYGKFLDSNPKTTCDLNDITINGETAKIIIRDTRQNVVGEALIDKEDVNKVKPYKWRLNKGGTDRSKCNGVYTGNAISSKCVSLHRLLVDCPKKNKYVDHINGNRLDNRKCNLRICSNQENNFNTVKRASNTFGYKGAWYDKTRRRWVSEIKYSNRKIFIERFSDIKHAIFTRFYAEELLQKEFISEESKGILKQVKEEIQDCANLIQVVNNKLKTKALI